MFNQQQRKIPVQDFESFVGVAKATRIFLKAGG
jgi:hypothetical protein